MELFGLEPGRFNRTACLIIVLVGLIVYSNTIHSSFHFDDNPNIVDNPLIKDLHNIPQFFQRNGITFPSRGLVTTSFAVNYYFSGLSVESYHWVNISIHLLNGMLVYFLAVIILNQYTRDAVRTGFNADARGAHALALFVALLFLTSPIQTHKVVYIFQRNGLMASFFYLLSLILFIKAVTGPGIRVYLYAGSILSFLCAIWSKETSYTAPAVMFLYYQCFIAGQWRSPGKGLKLMLPYIMLSLVSLHFGVLKDPPRMESYEWDLWKYLLTQANVLVEYAKLLLLPLPSRLNVDIDFPLAETLWELPTLISAVSVIAVLTAAVLFLDRARLVAFCVLWFFIILSPTSSIIPLRDLMVSYRLYLPGLAFYLLLAVGIHEAFCRLGERNGVDPKWLWRVELAVFISIVTFYGICAYERNKVWKTEFTLWQDAVNKSPKKLRPHFALGKAYHVEGLLHKAADSTPAGASLAEELLDKAAAEYLRCIKLYTQAPAPEKEYEYSLSCFALATIKTLNKDYEQAVALYNNGLKVNPADITAHYNLSIIYLDTGRMDEAEQELKLLVKTIPRHPLVHYRLGIVYERKGMPEEAAGAYTNAVRADPYNADAHVRLGLLMLNYKKDPAGAVRHLQEARRVCNDPKTLEMVNKILATLEKQTAVIRPSE